ncbi:MAG: substrate-binding domain-containing protein [Thermaurantiacus tibetensis]|uniref:substrate-binding domain-containing protein n=1 Tax=Thermaurantiacus tibetensis TaxID=2759035 RepID=UPI0018908318|nr:substrate-binding domain-containing protein [Thermaurantiacus tibetensis]
MVKSRRLGVALAALALVSACGDGRKAEGDAATGAAGGRGSDQIRIVGSATVYPFTTAVAEQFAQRFPRFKAPIVEATGTGGGIKLFCDNKGADAPDITNASRRMKASEFEQCRANGVGDIVEIQIGNDGLVLARARSGPDFPLTKREVYLALAAEPFGKPQTAKLWRDVNPSLPADSIEVIGPPPTSGTRDSFNEMFMEVGCDSEPAMKELKASDPDRHKVVCTKIREDGAFVEQGAYNLVVQRLTSNPKVIGIFGFDYLDQNRDKIKAVSIEGVEPTYEAIASGAYPGARPLFIYVRADRAREKPGLKEFLQVYASDATWGPGGTLSAIGLTPSPDEVRAAAAAAARNLTPLDPSTLG